MDFEESSGKVFISQTIPFFLVHISNTLMVNSENALKLCAKKECIKDHLLQYRVAVQSDVGIEQ